MQFPPLLPVTLIPTRFPSPSLFVVSKNYRSMSFLRSLFIIILCLLVLSSSSSPDPSDNGKRFADCSPSKCRCGGNTCEIYYPFRLQDSPNYCGHPEFNLICKENTTLFANISGKEYQVNSIDYTTRVLHLTDSNFAEESCPRMFTNTILNPSLYQYTNTDVELTVYFNCSPRPFLHNIPCLATEYGIESFYWFPGLPMPPMMDALTFCNSTVVVPIDTSAVSSFLTMGINDFPKALRQGFGLSWKVGEEWCKTCMDSGGICGNDPRSENSEACFCRDATSINNVCIQNTGKKKKKPTAIIGIAAGVGGALILGCCAFLLYNRRKKQRQASLSNLLSRSNSSKMSSKKDPELGDTNYHTHIFSYDELEEATNGFNASRELGEGGFGTVYKGKLRDGRTVAVKRLYENNYRRVEQFMNEVEILSLLRHPNLVTLYGCTSRHSRELLLVYEFIPNGTLADHLHGHLASDGALPWPARMSIAIETADALAYLHAVEPQIIHRDVKTNNILLDNSFHVKVADFGLSRLFPLDATHVSTAPQGTPGYVDPEYHQCYQLTDKSDVYSFGVVLVELISSKPAVDISRHRNEINLANMAITKIQNCQIDQLVDPKLAYQSHSETKGMINQVAELAFRCLQADREMRPYIKEVLEVLKGIEGGGFKAEKEAKVAEVRMKEETRLLKNDVLPFSPDSVTERWSSMSTTPNSST